MNVSANNFDDMLTKVTADWALNPHHDPTEFVLSETAQANPPMFSSVALQANSPTLSALKYLKDVWPACDTTSLVDATPRIQLSNYNLDNLAIVSLYPETVPNLWRTVAFAINHVGLFDPAAQMGEKNLVQLIYNALVLRQDALAYNKQNSAWSAHKLGEPLLKSLHDNQHNPIVPALRRLALWRHRALLDGSTTLSEDEAIDLLLAETQLLAAEIEKPLHESSKHILQEYVEKGKTPPHTLPLMASRKAQRNEDERGVVTGLIHFHSFANWIKLMLPNVKHESLKTQQSDDAYYKYWQLLGWWSTCPIAERIMYIPNLTAENYIQNDEFISWILGLILTQTRVEEYPWIITSWIHLLFPQIDFGLCTVNEDVLNGAAVLSVVHSPPKTSKACCWILLTNLGHNHFTCSLLAHATRDSTGTSSWTPRFGDRFNATPDSIHVSSIKPSIVPQYLSSDALK